MKFKYFNDTNRIVNIHPATFIHGCTGDSKPINPLEERTFTLPEGSYPWVKMWDYGEKIGLSILVSPLVDDNVGVETLHSQDNKVENDEVWKEILNSISSRIPKEKFDTWFKHTSGQIYNGALVVQCGNLFTRDWLDETYRDMILEVAMEVVGSEVGLELRSKDEE